MINGSNLRQIIHIDMDCFYAAVEMRDNPQYKNRPLAVGGKSKRSVLCTANYPARKFGVRAAIPSTMALKLCPELVIVPPNFQKYKQASEIIHQVFLEFTKQIQPLSLDEAFLDITHFSTFHDVSPFEIAQMIKKKILDRTELTASAGIANTKFLAKIASDWKKPNGIYEIKIDQVPTFLKDLKVKKLPGVGPVTNEKMKNLGLDTCLDLQNYGQANLIQNFGKFGGRLYELSLGIDHSEVKSSRTSKSLSIENTFKENLNTEKLLLEIPQLVDDFSLRFLRKRKNRLPKSIFVRIKLPNHDKKGLEKSVINFLNLSEDIEKIVKHNINNETNLEQNISDLSQLLTPYFSKLTHEIMEKHQSEIRLFGLGVRYQNPELDLSEIKNLKDFDQLNFQFA